MKKKSKKGFKASQAELSTKFLFLLWQITYCVSSLFLEILFPGGNAIP